MTKETITRDNVVSLYRATIAHDAQWLADFDACSADDQLTIACEEMEFDPDAPVIIATGGFNTGRLYSAKGQRIFWAEHSDGWVYIYDLDRMIDGWAQHTGRFFWDGEALNPAWVMRQYDGGKLEYSHPNYSTPRPSVPADFDFGPALRI